MVFPPKRLLNTGGMSPVVGVTLMIAITVGLSAVIGVVVLNVGSNSLSGPSNQVALDSTAVGETMDITLTEGNLDSYNFIYVAESDNLSYSGGISANITYADGPLKQEQYLYSSIGTEQSGGIGTTVNVNYENSSGGQIQVIGVNGDSQQIIQTYAYETAGTVESVNNQQTAPTNLTRLLQNMDGNGTAENPYQISNISEVQAVNADKSASYELTNTINATETKQWNNGSGFIPIGQTDALGQFTGTFDGNQYAISNVYINHAERNVGLFSISSGTIQNVSVTNSTITGSTVVGGVLGLNQNGDLANITVANTTVSGNTTGGLVGENNAGITGSIVQDATVTGFTYVGGLVGNNSGTITQSATYSGSSIAQSSVAGGFVGYNTGTLTQTVSNTTVESKDDAGGLTGVNGGTIEDSYAVGKTTGNHAVGGISGTALAGSLIDTSFAAGNTSLYQNATGSIGGVVGNGDGSSSANNAYWDKTVSNVTTSAVGSARTTTQMQGENPSLSGFNFTNIWHTTSKYPELQWENHAT